MPFCLGLLAVTVLPFALLGMGKVSLFSALAALSGTHVLATAYLFTDPDVRKFAVENPGRMIAVPLALMGGVVAIFSAIPGTQPFVFLMLAYLVWNNWHFGAQNVGVASFISLYERGRPLDRIEKNAIKAGVVVGLLGVLKAMSPVYMIGPELMPVAPKLVAVMELAYWTGAVLAVAMTIIVAILAARSAIEAHYLTACALFLSVTFMFPLYLTDNYTMGFVAFTVAHGLQYLIFLGTHGVRRGAAFVVLLLTMFVAWLIWSGSVTLDGFPLFTVTAIYTIGIAHIWLDQCLWRMRDKDRAAWMKDRFGFVLTHRHIPRRTTSIAAHSHRQLPDSSR